MKTNKYLEIIHEYTFSDKASSKANKLLDEFTSLSKNLLNSECFVLFRTALEYKQLNLADIIYNQYTASCPFVWHFNKELLKEEYVKDNDEINSFLKKATIQVSKRGSTHCVSYLISKGLVLETVIDEMLINATKSGHVKMVEFLLDNNGNINIAKRYAGDRISALIKEKESEKLKQELEEKLYLKEKSTITIKL